MTQLVPFIMSRDINGYNGFGLRPAGIKYNATLTSGAITSIQLPASYQRWVVIFSMTGSADVWVAYNDTAAVPAGNTLIATTSELNPTARQLEASDIISMITANDTANVSLVLYYLYNTQ